MPLQLRQPIDSHTTATCPSFKTLPRASASVIKVISKHSIKTLGLPSKKISGPPRPFKVVLGLKISRHIQHPLQVRQNLRAQHGLQHQPQIASLKKFLIIWLNLRSQTKAALTRWGT
jgi:hypothetical protein